MRALWSVLGNSQKLDGGAMFGNAPRAVWERWLAPDDHNRIPLACRAMLIEERDEAAGGGAVRRILFETGIRQFFCGPESFTPDHNYLMGDLPGSVRAGKQDHWGRWSAERDGYTR